MKEHAVKDISTTYWAAEHPDQIAQAINTKFDSYLHWLESSGQANRIQKSYDTFYGFNRKGGYGVEQDESDEAISRITVPHYKNLLSRIHSMTVQAKLAFKAKAINSDSKSLLEADFAEGLLSASVDAGLGQTTSTMVLTALVQHGSFVYAPWNRFAGKPVRPDNSGRTIFEGDQEYHVLDSFRCARSTSQQETPFYIVEIKRNKWDLISQYPDRESDILSGDQTRNPLQLTTPYSNSGNTDTDMDTVFIKVLLHKVSPSMPKGRVTTIIGDTVLEDDPFQYQTMPVVEMKAGEILGEIVADSPASSLIGIQEVLDRVYSANITNVLNNCISNIYSPDPKVSITTIRKGQSLITASQPPIAIALTGVSPDAVNLVNDLINQETLLSGLNNTAKGNPESSLKSGTSLSLILSTAIQYIGPIQQAYSQATAGLGTITINNLQSFCKTERLAYVAGIANKQTAKKFSASDLQSIDRVICELSNPVTQNMAGRMELVQMLLQAGAIKDPRKIDEFLRTGNWQSLTEDNFNEKILIREENEMLRRGQVPKVVLTDMHPQHIQEALSVLYSQEARSDPTVTRAVFAHVQEHLDMWPQVPPAMAAAINLPPAPAGPSPGPMPEAQPQGNAPAPNQPAPNVNGTSLPNGRGIPEGFSEGYDQYAQQISNNPAAQGQE